MLSAFAFAPAAIINDAAVWRASCNVIGVRLRLASLSARLRIVSRLNGKLLVRPKTRSDPARPVMRWWSGRNSIRAGISAVDGEICR
jgi:hypothetical protein